MKKKKTNNILKEYPTDSSREPEVVLLVPALSLTKETRSSNVLPSL